MAPIERDEDLQPSGDPHDWDDEAICKKCGLDGAEADWYSKRGYAHEYPTLYSCPGSRR